MTPDARLKQGFDSLGLHVEPNLDTSAGTEYAVYFYERKGALHGDDGPCVEHRRWTIVYVAPVAQNRLSMRNRIQQLIADLFGVWPSEENATNANGQRYIYEFDTIGGIDDGKS